MRLISDNLFFYFRLIILLCVLGVFFSCSTSSGVKKNENIRFALINNTRAVSPYTGPGLKIKPVIKKINEDNPVFLAHLGGMVCAGNDWLGITKIDIERQFSEIYSEFSILSPILYTVKGKSDLYNNSSDYYMKYTGKKDYYSFNLGNMHFLSLDSTGSGPMSEEQTDWIKKDLQEAKSAQAIFVFIHDPLFIPAQFKSYSIEVCRDFNLLHRFFTQYHVKAVFSGSTSNYFKIEVDGVLYINAGCGGFNANEFSKGYYQYYVADYKNDELSVRPRYVTLR